MTKPPTCRLSTRPSEVASSSATMAALSETAADVVRPVSMSVARSPWLRSDLFLEESSMRMSSIGPDSDTSMMTPETCVVPRTSSSGERAGYPDSSTRPASRRTMARETRAELPSRKASEPPTSGVRAVPPTRTAPSTTKLTCDDGHPHAVLQADADVQSRPVAQRTSALEGRQRRPHPIRGPARDARPPTRRPRGAPRRHPPGRYAPDRPVNRKSPDERVRNPVG